jgi:pyridoxine kinase
VLVGYLAHIDQVRLVATTLGKVRRASRDVLFLLDPVLGEEATGLYVEPGIAEAISERLVATADIVTPNAFELEYLSRVDVASLEDALRAADRVRARGPRVVICSSCPGAGEHEIATLAVTEDGAWRVLTPRLASRVFGTGDLLAAIFLAHYLSHGSIEDALGHAVSAVYGVLKATLARAADDLALIAAQDEIVNPSALFVPERLR